MGLRGKWCCDGLVMSAMNLSGAVMVHVTCTGPSWFKVLFLVSLCSDSQLNCPTESTHRYMQPNILSMTEVQREVSQESTPVFQDLKFNNLLPYRL